MSVLHSLAIKHFLFGQNSFPPGMVSVLCQIVMKVFVVYFAMNNGLNDSCLVELSMKVAQRESMQLSTLLLISFNQGQTLHVKKL